jgi:hypothetical protein
MVEERMVVMAYRDGTKKVKVGYSPEDYKTIQKKAASVNLCPTAYIRHISVNGEVKKIDSAPIMKMVLAVNRNGNNLNQIAKVANSTGTIFRQDIDDMKKDMEQIKQLAVETFKSFK